MTGAAAANGDERLACLLSVVVALTTAQTPADVAAAVIGKAGSALGTPSGALFLLNDDHSALELAASYQMPPDSSTRHARLPLTAPLPATVAVHTGRAVLFDAHASLVARFPATTRDARNQASAAVPLLLGTEVRGVVVLNLRETYAFTEEDQVFLLAVCRQAALALHRLQLLEAARLNSAALEGRVLHGTAELADSEARFELLVNSVQDYAIFMLDPEGYVASWNTGAVRIKGYSAEEIIGQHFSRFYLPEDGARGWPAHALSEALRVGRYEFEGWRVRKNGTRFWANVVITPVYAAGGRLAGYAKVTRDLTERRRTEEKIRETAVRLAEAEHVAHLGSWHWDVSTDVLTWSDELYRIFGVPQGTPMTYDAYLALVHPDDREAVHAGIQRALTLQRPFAFDHRIIRADGTQRVLQSVGEALAGADGELLALAGAGQDITERKVIEDELHQSREQLRQLSARLEGAREEERARIAREIHDELGGTLTGLKMDVAQLRHQVHEGDPAVLAKLEGFSLAIDGTVKTVRRIASDLRPAVLDDFGLLAALEWQLSEFQRRSGLDCTWKSETDRLELPPEAATAVFRIFQESLTNIARHAEAGCVDVKVVVQGGHLRLEVTDDGRGITQEETLGGASLGLVGMRERAAMLGGSVDIVRGAERGTTVVVRVPVGGKPGKRGKR